MSLNVDAAHGLHTPEMRSAGASVPATKLSKVYPASQWQRTRGYSCEDEFPRQLLQATSPATSAYFPSTQSAQTLTGAAYAAGSSKRAKVPGLHNTQPGTPSP
ncbi:MAG: hypothetical protein EBR51_00130 [Gammaproteobacteria bacterium]|nr:hypothetical protein [Gammaproteobacteria bacterium]